MYNYVHVLWIVEYIVDLFKPLGCFHGKWLGTCTQYMNNLVVPFKFVVYLIPACIRAGSELVNVFDLTVALWGPGEPELASTFVSYWTNFAATGNPNAAGLPVWEQYGGAAADLVASLDTGITGGVNVTMISGLKAGLCTLWGNITIPEDVLWG